MRIKAYTPDIDTAGGVVSADVGVDFLASAIKVKVASTDDTNDKAAGTGALTVKVIGLDSNYVEQSENITLTGQTEVETTKTYIAVNGLEVLTAGSGKTNAGILYVGIGTFTAGVPATKYLAVSISQGAAQNGLYTVPANYNFHPTKMIVATNTAAVITLTEIENATGVAIQAISVPIGVTAEIQSINIKDLQTLDGKSHVKISAVPASDNAKMLVFVEGRLRG